MDGLEWVRVLYAYPIHFTEELIETMATAKKIIPYLDMPLQHINDHVLRRMLRRVDRTATEDLLGRLRKAMPNLTLRTTFIVGFPGETDAEFEELRDLCKRPASIASASFRTRWSRARRPRGCRTRWPKR